MEMSKVGLSVYGLLDKLKTINEDNLPEIELYLYALKGLVCEDDFMSSFCDYLIESFDMITNCKEEGKRCCMKLEIRHFKNYIEFK